MRRILLIAALTMSSSPLVAAPAARPDEIVYTVQAGDTLIDLAKRGFNRRVDYVVAQRLNRIANPRALQPGSAMRIPARILRTRPIDAKVIAFRGNALVGGSKARVGLKVVEGSTLQTGADGFLTIELGDGSQLTLPSRSTMKVVGLHRIVLTGAAVKSFELLTGRTETEVQKAERPTDRFEIHTPVSVAAVRGTKFRVTFGDQGAAGASVLEGTVGVGAAGKVVAVPQGKGIVATAKGPGALVALLPKPDLTDPDRVQDEEILSFPLKPVAQAARYRVQLARDAGFVETFGESEAATPLVTFADVPNGSFFARATAISAEGIEGFPAVYTFERRLNAIKAEVNEPDNCPARRCLRFRWRAAGEGEHRYRFQLATVPGGFPVIDEPEMRESEIVLTDLPGGTYYWRVESSLIDGGRRQSKWMNYQELRVSAAPRR
jgi:hypothetical protein